MISRFSSLSVGIGRPICPAQWSYPVIGKTVPSHKGLRKQSKTVDVLTIEESEYWNMLVLSVGGISKEMGISGLQFHAWVAKHCSGLA